MIETARVLAKTTKQPKYRVEFVAFDGEDVEGCLFDPYLNSQSPDEDMIQFCGSYWYVNELKRAGKTVVGNINVDSIAHYSDEPNTIMSPLLSNLGMEEDFPDQFKTLVDGGSKAEYIVNQNFILEK